MHPFFKTIGAGSIVVLTLAAVAETAAALTDKDIISDQTVCLRGLNSERDAWLKDSFYGEEAVRRGLTVDGCRQMLAQPVSPPTFNPPASTAQRSEFEVLSYETGLSKSFLAKFQEAAEKLNIGPAESNRIIVRLSGELKDLPRNGWYAPTYQRLGRIDDGQRLLNQLMKLVNQQDVEHAVTMVTSSMREGGRSYRRYVAETFGIHVRMALLFDGIVRSEVEILGYETGLSTEFLGEFQRAARNLNVEPVDSLPIIVMLSEKLTDFEWFGPAERRLNDIGASGLRRDLGRFMKAGDVQAAAELVLKTMKGENPATRRYIAQTFGIPESTVLVYDEMQRLGKGTTGRSSPY